ncbi:unnamed protein product [Camellia sinensis]
MKEVGGGVASSVSEHRVYGDIGTSPLYVYASTFSSGINHNDDILGVMSLIIYTRTLIPLFTYVLVVLRANDNGNGGTFALYSLICRYAQVGLVPSQEAEDRDVSTFSLELPNPPPNPNNRVLSAARLKSKLEKSIFAKSFLLFATMLGTSMVIGDGILTPCISGTAKKQVKEKSSVSNHSNSKSKSNSKGLKPNKVYYYQCGDPCIPAMSNVSYKCNTKK